MLSLFLMHLEAVMLQVYGHLTIGNRSKEYLYIDIDIITMFMFL